MYNLTTYHSHERISVLDKKDSSQANQFGVAKGVTTQTALNNLGVNNWLQAPTTVRIKAGNVNDDSAGSGAQTVRITGIDDSLDEITEEITTNGTSPSTATTNLFWRVYLMEVQTVGTYTGSNTGDIVLESGGTDLIKIVAGEGKSKFGAFTVPLGWTGYLRNVVIDVDGNKNADVKCFTRKNFNDTSTPSAVTEELFYDGVSGSKTDNPNLPLFRADQLTDIWFEASGAGGDADISVRFGVFYVNAL